MAGDIRLTSTAGVAPAEVPQIMRPLHGAEPIDAALAHGRHRLTAHASGVDVDTVTDQGVPDAQLMQVVRPAPAAGDSPPDGPYSDAALPGILARHQTSAAIHPQDASHPQTRGTRQSPRRQASP
ncbi:hypothetical protein EDC02_2274 [Micromonospora sp. Llam0]|uniref:hypothetical protein n=1 Tax=Micromonospora sp. Llam0 TaxID=2485143 RepID=UPI000F47A224|nr:hypothetical protein [Micromonospora sp. Llam0]ROO60408.1 hypothetical protein EDC02_2274 [Micromonospora sp. Llam0]